MTSELQDLRQEFTTLKDKVITSLAKQRQVKIDMARTYLSRYIDSQKRKVIKMASFNKVILIGNMTSDPELKQSTSGVSVSSFSIAVNRKMSKNNDCDFITIVAWRQQAEFVCKYFKKGQPILVCGQLQTRTWTDNQNNKRYATEVVADEVSFVGNKEGSGEAKNEAPTQPYMPGAYTGNSQNFEEIPTDDGLPF